MLFDENSRWFFQEQIDLYEKYKDSEPGIFAFHDEDSANLILSKYKLDICAPKQPAFAFWKNYFSPLFL